MKSVFLFLCMLPLIGFSQTQDTYIRLTDVNGKQINGNATMKGFEKWIQASSLTPGGKNNVQLSFTTGITGASAELKKAMLQGEFLLNGQVSVVKSGLSGMTLIYKISMEKIKVNSCSETLGCNNVMGTTVTLTATRIGWTYYQQDKSGVQSISNKYGFDSESGRAWTNF